MFPKNEFKLVRTAIILVCCSAQLVWANASNGTQDQECAVSPLHATWQVSERTNKKNGKAQTTDYLVSMWRSDNQVALHYSNGNVTELWGRLSNSKVNLVRYFEREQRGIEYMPNEIKKEQNWQDKWQLISDTYKDSLPKKSVKGTRCETVESYRRKNKRERVKLDWLKEQNIVKLYELKTKERRVRWTLLSVSADEIEVKNKFVSLGHYQTTDYTDIGDNESDPFLAKMINMGFVGQGASGFYNAEGDDIGEHHHH